MDAIYLDHIAARSLIPGAYAAMLPFLSEHFGNPNSQHHYADLPRKALENARNQLAKLIHCEDCEIIFTASGSEANNLAIKGVLAAGQKKGRHIITTNIEHYSVAHPLKYLEKEAYAVTYLPVDKEGRVTAAQVKEAICDDTILVSILHANNEIGTIQAIEEIGQITQEADVFFHVDAVATIGVIPFDCDLLGIDLAAFAAQSFYGPKGVGALYLRRGTRLSPLIAGGIQELGRRAGTENVAGIVGMGQAAAEAIERMTSEVKRLTQLRNQLIDGLLNTVPLLHLTGSREHRLPHIASFAVEYLDGQALVQALENRGIMAASGSSCSADALKISPVLKAIALPGNVAQGGIVFSLGLGTNEAQIASVLSIFPECVEALRSVSPLYAALKMGGQAG